MPAKPPHKLIPLEKIKETMIANLSEWDLNQLSWIN